MALEGIIESIRKAKADIIRNREQDGLRIAFDVLALVKLRIQTSGVNSEGVKFAPYTPFTVRERRAGGYQVGFVDYTQTGRFWATIRPRVDASTIVSATIVIGPTDAYGREILIDAEPKRGNLLLASKEEIDFARKANIDRVTGYLNKI
jgi:hypothetical protein